MSTRGDRRIPILYLAPWVDYGGSDKGTIDWFRWLDRDRFAPLLATTQPSDNRRLAEVYPYAEEVWSLSEFLAGQDLPGFIFDLIHTRRVQLLHIMNSRIGFDLLPDLGTLHEPPAVAVQLHVEETDKSGYVRYVTTRYGNLVDAFSVSSRHLADVVAGYEVPRGRIHVIPTGVDAEREFNPARVTPVSGVDPRDFNILFAGRLTDQKDPLLMTEVIRRVAPSRQRIRVHVVGDGPLQAEVQAAVGELGLDDHFRFHPPARNLAPWYAASDLLLMTSAFEGVPYVVYEAMAMALAIVAPALAGNVELMGDTGGILVEPRDDPDAYADALDRLIRDAGQRAALGAGGRKRVAEEFSVRSMGARHATLYESLLEARQRRMEQERGALNGGGEDGAAPSQAATRQLRSPEPLGFTRRRMHTTPLVSVVVPCFNHGRFLTGCVDSVLSQDYPEIELIVIDDGSTDRDTREVLDELAARPHVCVIRSPTNSGPSAARNRGIAQAKGRFVLPVDADNRLAQGAIHSLVRQLQSAGERVGFIYPNLQYFGTREDYYQPPSYNLALLLDGNYCDSCSLIDREVFDAGMCYSEDIRLGHEDWDFALSLAECDVIGQPARDQTLLYRKLGFTRSDTVEYARRLFRDQMAERHPRLYGDEGAVGRFWRWSGTAAQIKAVHAPGVSLVMTSPLDLDSEEGARLLRRLDAQSCRDLELILECPSAPRGDRRVRRIPPGLCSEELARLQEGLDTARGTLTLVAGDEMPDLLAEPGFVERLQRTFIACRALRAIAFVDAGDAGRFPYSLLRGPEVAGPAHALAWLRAAEPDLPVSLLVDGQPAVESLAQVMNARDIGLQWRHSPARRTSAGDRAGATWLRFPSHRPVSDPHARAERQMVAKLPPALPSLPPRAVRRWDSLSAWVPAESTLLVRHRSPAGERRVTIGREPPLGFAIEYDLGAVRCFSPPGTARLVRGERGFRTVPRGCAHEAGEEVLGYVELAALPLWEPLERAVLADGSETLVAGERDPLRSSATELHFLGFTEAYPPNPPFPPDARSPRRGVVGLLRSVQTTARRHVYGVDLPDGAELVAELGALHRVAEPDSTGLWIDEEGRVTTSDYAPLQPAPGARDLIRWALAPAAWRGFGRLRGRARAVVRRTLECKRLHRRALRARGRQRGPGSSGDGSGRSDPAGYLHTRAAPGRLELLAATHPVTGDQLLTHHRLEAADMGYRDVVSLGFLLARAPVTGTLEPRRVAVPWASRFGLEVRRG